MNYKSKIRKMLNVANAYEALHAPHIVIIDDGREDRSYLRNFIRAYFNDIPVRTYKDGAHFFDSVCESFHPYYVNAQSIRAIFIEMHMDEMCGRETLNRIRQMKEFSNVPVYVMGDEETTQAQIDQALKMGAEKFIPKPFDKLEISMTIEKDSVLQQHAN